NTLESSRSEPQAPEPVPQPAVAREPTTQPVVAQEPAKPVQLDTLNQTLITLGATASEPQAPQPQPQPVAVQEPAAPEASTPCGAAPAAEPEPAASRPQSGPDQGESAKPADKSQDGTVERTSCATCGGFHHQLDGHSFSESGGCASGNCIPGRGPCYLPGHACDTQACNTVVGAFLTNLYQSICCPDPCYQPKWEPEAYASFFADYARPRTVTRIRYDNLENMTRPDRNQFWINL